MPYDHSNRAFVQAFMAKRILTFDDAIPILSAILTGYPPRNPPPKKQIPLRKLTPNAAKQPNNPFPSITFQLFQAYIHTANTALSPYDFQIKSVPSQTGQSPRETYYILTNTTSDDLMQLATTHSAEDIAFFRRLLDTMFETNNTLRMELCAVKGMDAIRLHKPRPGDLPFTQTQQPDPSQPAPATQQQSTGAGLTMKEAELALSTFVSEGWLDLSPAGFYSLTPRALAELHRYLIDTYNSPDEPYERIKTCHGCKELLTVGQRCEKSDCPIRLHDPCAEGLFRVNREKKCPGCGGRWTCEKFVGERAAKGVRPRVSATGSGRGSGSRRVSGQSVVSQLAGPSRRVQRRQEEGGDEDGLMETE